MPLVDTSFLQGLNPQTIANQQIDEQQKQQMAPLQMQGQQVQNQTAQEQLNQTRRANAINLNASILNAPPDKQEAMYQTIKPILSRMAPDLQFPDSFDPLTARALQMSNVPATDIPTYQMNTAKAAFYNKLAGGNPPAAPAPNSAVTPNGAVPLGAPIQPAPAQPQSLLSDPNVATGLAIFDPAGATALATVQKAQYESPEGKRATAELEARGKQAAEAAKGAVESTEGYNQVKQTLDALRSLIGTTDKDGNFVPNSDLPQSKYFIPAKGWAAGSQNVGDQKTADAYNTFSTLNESQTINAIRDLASTGQIKMTRTLENIINRGYLIDPDASPTAKIQQANAIETELRNSAVAAQNVSAKMSGGGEQVPYTSPLTAPPGSSQPQTAATQAQNKISAAQPKIPTIGTISKGYVFLGGDPSSPASWKPVK